MNRIRARMLLMAILLVTGGVSVALRPDDEVARLLAVASVALTVAVPVVFARRPSRQPDATAGFSWRAILPGALSTMALHAIGNQHGRMTQLTAALDLGVAVVLLARVLAVRRDEPPA